MTDLIIVGIVHLFGRDDVFSDNMQKELIDFSETLAKLNPTKIAVEMPCRHQDKLDAFYKKSENFDYAKKTFLGELDLYGQTGQFCSNNEIVQLGFRIAKKLQHTRLYAVDEDIEMSDALMDKISSQFSPDSYIQRINNLLKNVNNFEEQIRILNREEYRLIDHNAFLAMNKANIGNYEGTQLMVQWYDRNLRMYSNLQNLAKEGERVMLIVGSSHLQILHELAKADENINLIEWA